MRKAIQLGSASLVLMFVLAALFSVAFAESTINRIMITNLDFSGFPEIVVQAVIRDQNSAPVPSTDLSPEQGSVQLLENGDIVEHSFKQITLGVETMIVVDTEVNSVEAKITIQDLVNAMKVDDSFGIILTSSDGSQYIRPLTKDKQVIQQFLEGLTITPTGERLDNFDAVQLAYDELENSLNYKKLVQSVVFISSGLHTVQPEEINEIVIKAREINAPIHVISFASGTFAAGQMAQLSDQVGGIFVDKSFESITSLLAWQDQQRIQYQFVYRSELSGDSDRTVELRTSSGSTHDLVYYQIDVAAPLVIIDSPPNNIEYIREAETYAIGQTSMDGVEPTTVDVQVHLEWPDGYPRIVEQAILLIDNEYYSTPIRYPGESFKFSWDLRPYRAQGANTAQLRVEIMDELGLSSVSAPVAAKITVIIPDPPITQDLKEQVEDICADLEGFDLTKCQISAYVGKMFSEPSGWIAVISLVVAIGAVIFAFRFRGQIAQGAGVVFENVRETITRLTRAGGSEIGAYLEILRGDEHLIGQSIPLYLRTVTPAGRDPQQAEIVFQVNEERSVISRKHCEFREEDGTFRVRDVGSSHGTYVNGLRLPEGGEGHELTEGDKIEIGPAARGGVLLVFKSADQPARSSSYADADLDIYDTNPAYGDGSDYDDYDKDY